VSTAFAYKLADFQVNRPALPLLLAVVITAIALHFATKLTMRTGFEAMLPENRPSVVELHRVAQKTAGVSTLFVVLKAGPSTPRAALRKAADALVPQIEKIGPPWVGAVEDGMQEALRFLEPRAGLFADRAKLQKVRDDVEARYEYEVEKQAGTLIDDDAPPPPIDAAKIRETFGPSEADEQDFPDGYYEGACGPKVCPGHEGNLVLVVAVRSKTAGGDFKGGSETIQKVTSVVDHANLASFDPGITYGLAGDLHSAITEYAEVNKDLTDVGVLGSCLIASVVFFFFLRIRTLIAMVLTIAMGVAWTFGITQVLIGHLNMATGFLFTIIAGNGINFGIIYMARFLEARRRGATLQDAVRIAHRETWLPTLTAGCTAAASYGSLVITEFRGFRDFGEIGSIGMVFCWIATYLTLPCILAVMERILPIKGRSSTSGPPSSLQVGFFARLRRLTRTGVAFGKPFAAIVPVAPRAMLVTGVGLALAGLIATVVYVRGDPMEYNLLNLRDDPAARAKEGALNKRAEEITQYVGASGMAILVDRPDQVAPLRDELYRRRDAAPPGKKPFKSVAALQDFVPDEQAQKLPLLMDLKDRVMRAKKRGLIKEEDWDKLAKYLPPDGLKPFGMEDLPVAVARTFTETDGTRGRMVFIIPTRGDVVDDAHYLFLWADAYRETRLPDGSIIRGSGSAVIYADMWSAVLDDVPPAVLFSFGATVLVVIVAFRAGRAALAVLAGLLVGVCWMVGMLVVIKAKLNFLNFVALPITFGIGVDYAVNIVERYVREGAGGVVSAVANTGGAVILCSLTTTLGYFALVSSLNLAVRSMGLAAVFGEVSCMLAAVLVLPAGLLLIDRNLPKGARSTLSLHAPRK
jgi:predicted RND superfamily exporter protein